MSAVLLIVNKPDQVSLTTAMTRLIFGDDIDYVEISAPDDMYLVLDDTINDGDAVPATARFRIPANTIYPILNIGIRPLICAKSGTTTANLLPQPREEF